MASARTAASIQLFGGGVIRIRPDGTGLEVVSTGECNPLSVCALGDRRDLHLRHRRRQQEMAQQPDSSHRRRPLWLSLPVLDLAIPRSPDHGRLQGGAGAQGICYNEDGLAAEFRGNLFFCDWGIQAVSRFEIRKAGGTYAVSRRIDPRLQGRLSRLPPVFARRLRRRGEPLARGLGLRWLAG